MVLRRGLDVVRSRSEPLELMNSWPEGRVPSGVLHQVFDLKLGSVG